MHGVLPSLRAGITTVKTLEIVDAGKHDDQACLYQITDRGVVAHPDQNVLALLGGEEA